MRALVIDDSKTMRMIIGKILKEVGFDTAEAANGIEALDRLRDQGPFELAMVDWNMPEMNGLEFIKAARAESAYNEMKMMMVTTETEVSAVSEALASGANEYAMKPFTKEVILEKLALLGLA